VLVLGHHGLELRVAAERGEVGVVGEPLPQELGVEHLPKVLDCLVSVAAEGIETEEIGVDPAHPLVLGTERLPIDLKCAVVVPS
jgi:hypothetical protein